MRCQLLALACLGGLLACQPAGGALTDAERTAIADEVTRLDTEFWDAWMTMDIERGMSFYRGDPAPVWAWDGEVRSGLETLRAWFIAGLEGVHHQTITFDERQVTVLDRNVAYMMERGSFIGFGAAGVELGSGQFAVSSVWVRSDGEWKVAGGHESLPSSEPEGM